MIDLTQGSRQYTEPDSSLMTTTPRAMAGLALMDFSSAHAPDVDWAEMHEQYRPFVLFHRTQAAALRELEGDGPQAAVVEIDAGVEAIRQALRAADDEELDDEDLDSDELVVKLQEMKTAIADQYHVEPSLREQLAAAIAAEQYERAAQLRDKINEMKGAPTIKSGNSWKPGPDGDGEPQRQIWQPKTPQRRKRAAR